ncbi:hypothetical protein AB595_04820 [Massilia sp. WF1]|uniref:hypothetical protein n=1 Tax=unclassified Massilia TaxID=2609279 RepID=UPI000649816C|nr:MULTISPECIES: hypothetical protein [unclassified Massilia]ALK96993.1 hypothetical protein AM586_12730 [Massilia sp. WG5]KLU37943.1 hypothetical protein AB595_04820 [Massilia sp. WF1]
MTDFHGAAAARYPYNTAAGYDYKAWAKRIVWRHETGDKTLLPIQIKFAQEAMGVSAEQAAA